MRLKAHARLQGPGFLGVVCIVVVVFANFGLLSGCGGGSSSGSSGEVITASTTSTPQSEQVGRSFQPLTVTVTNNGSPMGNVTVTFTAPSTGASGTFVNKTATDTETTDAGGIATATNFTANTIAGSYSVTASASGASSATFSLSNTAGAAATITATKGSNQTQALGVAFGTDLEATVLDSDSNPVSGAVVTFTAPGSGASATFAASGGLGAPGARHHDRHDEREWSGHFTYVNCDHGDRDLYGECVSADDARSRRLHQLHPDEYCGSGGCGRGEQWVTAICNRQHGVCETTAGYGGG